MPWRKDRVTDIERLDEKTIEDLLAAEHTSMTISYDGETVCHVEDTAFTAARVRCRELTTANMEALERDFKAKLLLTEDEDDGEE